ncbi:hypothetical protein Acr_29g0004850 [Actinidia rufa]|uniref:Uncharacterized protein n=1 Tax=Actinidia rufa TaxID=165716 RepID=A0A7J0HDZ0_9ERIC|nr:hypothetical protein Acr_29g0004850 [Actinidia rufa]
MVLILRSRESISFILLRLFRYFSSEIDETRARFMHAIASDLPMDIVSEPDETRILVSKAISRHTLRISNAHLDVAPPIPQLWTHVVDLDPSNDETPLATTDVPSSSTAPPTSVDLVVALNSKIADAIAALVTHMNVIYTNLVERIRQVYEHIDMIVERQAHDIVSIRNTL